MISLYRLDQSEFMIQEPLVHQLERDHVHSFSVMIKNIPFNVQIKHNEKYIDLEKDKSNEFCWKLDKSFQEAGLIKFYVDYNLNNTLHTLTQYQVL
jgi:hypothetical protein